MKILIITHGELATYLLKTAEMIIGTQDENFIEIINFYPQDSMETLKEKLINQIKKFIGEEILILTDLKGGTPFNVAFLLLKEYKFYLITGVNLPMLLEILLLKEEEKTGEEVVKKIADIGRDGICIVYS
ncbi:PTS sugar transporter subunit IIA [Thermoanaerobacter thermohydrosulfuricus]